MGMTIRDGTGTGNQLKIDSENRAAVLAVTETKQHNISESKGQAYHVIGTATPASATVVSLHIKNTSSDKNLIVDNVLMQIIDPANGTALPNASNYFRIALDRTLTSGGSTATAVNLNASSGNSAEITGTQGTPTLGGTAAEIERWYPEGEAKFFEAEAEGAIVLGPTNTLEIAFVGDHTAGTIYSRLSFHMEVL